MEAGETRFLGRTLRGPAVGAAVPGTHGACCSAAGRAQAVGVLRETVALGAIILFAGAAVGAYPTGHRGGSASGVRGGRAIRRPAGSHASRRGDPSAGGALWASRPERPGRTWRLFLASPIMALAPTHEFRVAEALRAVERQGPLQARRQSAPRWSWGVLRRDAPPPPAATGGRTTEVAAREGPPGARRRCRGSRRSPPASRGRPASFSGALNWARPRLGSTGLTNESGTIRLGLLLAAALHGQPPDAAGDGGHVGAETGRPGDSPGNLFAASGRRRSRSARSGGSSETRSG